VNQENFLMSRIIVSVLICLFVVSTASAQRSAPATQAELDAITERGRQLAAYDVAAWHATDAVQATSPAEGSVDRYIAQKTGERWTVVFGRFNEKQDKFLIAYEATQGQRPEEFTVKKHDPPQEDAGFYFKAAKAIETTRADFGGVDRPYNIAVLPAPSGQMYVYFVPAQTVAGIFPLGGDVRYTISGDGAKMVEKRQLHKSIIEFRSPVRGEKLEAGFHTAVLDEIPEDTDVFHVLARSPSVPEWIGTQKFVYLIQPDGSIKYLMTMEAFKKVGKKPQ
jgi:hypothetical protein